MPTLSQRISNAVQNAFFRAFYKWGHFTARRPCLVIWGSVVLSILVSARLMMGPLPSEVEQDRLWVPQEAQAVYDKQKYDAAFSTTFRRSTLYFTTKPKGGNVITSSILEEIRRFDELVTGNLTATHSLDGREYGALDDEDGVVEYEDVCAKSEMSFGGNESDIPACLLFGHPLELWYITGGNFSFGYSDKQLLEQVNSGRGIDTNLFPESSNRTVNVEAIFGGVTKDKKGRIIGAKSIQMTYNLDEHPNDSPERERAIAWEDQLNYLIDPIWTDNPPLSRGSAWGLDEKGHCNKDGYCQENMIKWESDLIDIFPQTSGATSRELSKNIRGDLAALNIGFMAIFVYALIVLARFEPVRSRAALTAAGVASCGLAIMVAYGLSTGIGFKLNPVINVLPFVLIGIGVDDMFVLVNALEAVPTDLDVPTRVATAIGHAGVSITITSLTDLMAFALGTTSQLPALKTFCVFAAIGIAADFILQISFFAGWMALDAYREKKNKIDCCPCCFKPTNAANGCCCCFCCFDKCGAIAAPEEGRLRAFMRKRYVPCLRNKAVKAAVLVAFVGYTGFSLFQATKLKQDFKFRWFVNDDAPLQAVFDVQDEYFNETGLPVNIVTPPSETFHYASLEAQMKLVKLDSAIDANPFIESDSLSFWYPGFREWLWQCGQTEVYEEGEGPLEGTSCKRRDCNLRTAFEDGSGELPKHLEMMDYHLFPYCHFERNERNSNEELSKDAYDRNIPGGYEKKFMVDVNGKKVLPDSYQVGDVFVPPEKFWKWLDQYLMDAPLGGLQSSEIIWLNNDTVKTSAQIADGISATRLRANYINTPTADEQVESMVSLRASVASAEVEDAFPYMFMYLYYEQYAIIESEALWNLGLALVAVFVIVMTIIASIPATILVMLCVVMVDINILGLMYMWDLSIDSVAIINLVLAVGLAVDYSAHIAHSFVIAKGTKQERADHAVLDMGVAVIHGAVSTFVAVLILSTSKSYIFRVFFKQFFGICIFGAAHGVCFLPVCLSLVGPPEIDVDVGHGGEYADKATTTTTTTEKAAHAIEMGHDAKDVEPQVSITPPTETATSAPPSPPSSECGTVCASPLSPVHSTPASSSRRVHPCADCCA